MFHRTERPVALTTDNDMTTDNIDCPYRCTQHKTQRKQMSNSLTELTKINSIKF